MKAVALREARILPRSCSQSAVECCAHSSQTVMDFSHDSLHVDSDIARAWTLPAHLYTDPATFAAEKEKIFARTWQVVGHASQVEKPGDYFTTQLLGEPLLFVRGSDGNTARLLQRVPSPRRPSRRRLRLAEACFAAAITAGPMALTARLSVRPRSRESKAFEPEDFSLVPVRTEEWFNLVFVNLDPQAAPLRESLGELPQQAEKFPFAGMKLFERRTYDMKCNWKTYVDNYLEGYHLPSVHPGLNRELDYNAYVVEPYAQSCTPVQPDPRRAAGRCHAAPLPGGARRSDHGLLLDLSQLDAQLLSRQRLAEHCFAA